jgi:hypothetical protein
MPSKSPGAQQVREPLTSKAEAQQVLDELWKEKLTPFKLNVGKITEDTDARTVHFYDSRMRRVRVPSTEANSFRDTFREVVLARVARLSGPLKTALPART